MNGMEWNQLYTIAKEKVNDSATSGRASRTDAAAGAPSFLLR